MSESPVLELRGVSKSFGAVQALYQVDFHVAPGEVMALVGDNGAGKSTLVKLSLALAGGQQGQTTGTTRDETGKRDVPSVLLDPVSIMKGNVATPVKDGAVSKSEVCNGKFAALCTKAGIS